jgi:adenylate cyclase
LEEIYLHLDGYCKKSLKLSLKQRSSKYHEVINAAVALGWYGALDGLELKTIDFRFRHFTYNSQLSDRVVIAAIDEKSLYELKKNYNTVWKWPRDIYALLVEYFRRGGANVVLFDMLFSDPDIDRRTTGGAVTDGKFAAAMGNADNVILAMQLLETPNVLTGDNPYTPILDSLYIIVDNRQSTINGYPSAILPLSLFQRNAASLGFANYQEDKQDGICRRIQVAGKFQGKLFFQLGVVAYLNALEYPSIELHLGQSFLVGEYEFPLTDASEFLLS